MSLLIHPLVNRYLTNPTATILRGYSFRRIQDSKNLALAALINCDDRAPLHSGRTSEQTVH